MQSTFLAINNIANRFNTAPTAEPAAPQAPAKRPCTRLAEAPATSPSAWRRSPLACRKPAAYWLASGTAIGSAQAVSQLNCAAGLWSITNGSITNSWPGSSVRLWPRLRKWSPPGTLLYGPASVSVAHTRPCVMRSTLSCLARRVFAWRAASWWQTAPVERSCAGLARPTKERAAEGAELSVLKWSTAFSKKT